MGASQHPTCGSILLSRFVLFRFGVQASAVDGKILHLLFLCEFFFLFCFFQSETFASLWLLSGRNILLPRALPLQSCENSQHRKRLSNKQGSLQGCWIPIESSLETWISYSGSGLTDSANGNQGDAFLVKKNRTK